MTEPRPSARPFVVCIHDATPAFARELDVMLRDLAPLIGKRLSLGVVPDWHGDFPLSSPKYSDHCALLKSSAGELLLHGHRHHRAQGGGLVSLLAERSDEMSGLSMDDTSHLVSAAQREFAAAFGAPARGFVPPAWQRGQVRGQALHSLGLEYVMGYFALSAPTHRIALATYTWDCGRWGWLGHVGDLAGHARHAMLRSSAIPTLALHPRDVTRGHWPRIVGLTRDLLHAGYEPVTPAALLSPARRDAQAAA